MILASADAQDFFRIIQPLDVFFVARVGLPGGEAGFQALRSVREAGFSDPAHIAAYQKENPHHLSKAALSEVRAWQQHGLQSRFLALQQRKDGCLLMSTEGPRAAYLVQGLTQPLEELLPFLPCYVETRLLPWRGCIVSDGIVAPLSVHFGGSMRASFKEEAKEIIATQGLITTLPADASAPDPAVLLKHYLSTAANRRDFAPQIAKLRRQSPELEITYLQQMGKVSSRALKAALKAKGLAGHFAVLEDTIITGAPDKRDATACAEALLPPALRPGVVWLKV